MQGLRQAFAGGKVGAMSEETFVQLFWSLALVVGFVGALCLGAGIRALILRASATDWAARRRPAALRRWAEILKGD